VAEFRISSGIGRAALGTALLALLLPSAALGWGRMPQGTHVTYGEKRLVEIPESIPDLHAQDRIDRRLLPQIRYLSDRFKSFEIQDAYGGKPHTKYGEHPLGLAVDVQPLDWDGKGCDGSWRQISRIARWAEPRQNRPRPPFRWVGYNHDAGHGCGDHLHLSWSHAPAKPFHKADWVELFDLPDHF
jgi:hypothetical protein